MLAIKLSRFGKKKMPTYRIVVLEHTKDPWGDYLEKLGSYNPRDKKIELNKERVKYWISKGAKPSNTVHNLLVSQGVIKENKKTVSNLTKKRKVKLNEKTKAKVEKELAPKTEEAPKDETPKEEIKTEEAPKDETPKEEIKTEEAPKEKNEAEKK